MTTPTTLADWAHTCRQRAATLLENAGQAEDLAREYGHRGNGPANRFRAEAADWQAGAALIDAVAFAVNVHGVIVDLDDVLLEAAKRLVARLDRP